MGNRKQSRIPMRPKVYPDVIQKPKPIVTSLLDEMIEGREYQSIIDVQVQNIDLVSELKRALDEISVIRHRPIVCYIGNVFNQGLTASNSIDFTDNLPFSEMLDSIDPKENNIDIVLITPGGSGEQVASFVSLLRPRFESVCFILPSMCMSAGTILCLSGDELIMDSRAFIGPIDPQVHTKDGSWVPAQSIITLLEKIREKGEESIKKGINPDWTDLQILVHLDAKEIGNAYNASEFSTKLVEEHLWKYKFKNWITRSSTGNLVTDEDRKRRAREIAVQLCDHSKWLSHSRGISRDAVVSECRLQITKPEDVPGLHRSIRRFEALVTYFCERTGIIKLYVSNGYQLLRIDTNAVKPR